MCVSYKGSCLLVTAKVFSNLNIETLALDLKLKTQFRRSGSKDTPKGSSFSFKFWLLASQLNRVRLVVVLCNQADLII